MTREVLPAASAAKGEPITSTLCLFVLDRLSQFWGFKWLVRDAFQLTQDYYPETMGQLLVINAPSSFTIIWNVVKPWLAKETIAKIDVLGSNYKDELLKLIDIENLPQTFGGTCTCSELGGCEWGNAGPWLKGRKDRRRQLYGDRTTNGAPSTNGHANGNANGAAAPVSQDKSPNQALRDDTPVQSQPPTEST